MNFINKNNSTFIVGLIFIHLIFFVIASVQENYFTFSGNNFKLSDSYQYLIEAKNIVSHGEFYSNDLNQPINPKYYSLRPPVYPIFLSLFKYFNAPLYLVLLIQNIISIVSIYLVRKTVLLFKYQKKYDFLFLLLILLTPSQLIYANTIMSEVIFQFFLILTFYYAVLFFQNNHKKYIIGYSIAIILAAYTKPVMYLFVIPSLFYMIYLSLKIKKWYPTLIGLIPIIAVLFIFTWNHKRTNHYEYSSIQTINLLNYNTRLFILSKQGFSESEKIIDSIYKKADLISDYSQKTKFLNQSSVSILKDNFLSYTVYHLQGSFYSILDPGRFDIANFFLINTKKLEQNGILYHLNNGGFRSVFNFLSSTYSISLLLLLGIILTFNLFKLICFIFFIFNPKITFNLKIITCSLFFYIVFLAGPVGASRYLIPLVPIIIGVILIDNYYINLIEKKIKSLAPKKAHE
jgi:hypothetical protein